MANQHKNEQESSKNKLKEAALPKFSPKSSSVFPQEPPGDMPSISEEYQYIGITKDSGHDDKYWKKSDD